MSKQNPIGNTKMERNEMRLTTRLCADRKCKNLARAGFRKCPSCISGKVIKDLTGEEE
jgi:hypothetical protein